MRHLLAVTTHRLLDLLLLIMMALGITNVFAHAFPLFNLWYFPRLSDEEVMGSVNAWHGVVANIIITVVLFHSAAALFHHYVIKDGVLRRMGPNPRALGIIVVQAAGRTATSFSDYLRCARSHTNVTRQVSISPPRRRCAVVYGSAGVSGYGPAVRGCGGLEIENLRHSERSCRSTPHRCLTRSPNTAHSS